MKRILLPLLLISAPLAAQDIYRMESFSATDLNGTARFVGMGGAMSALGADISVMSTNPAGIGLFRRGDVAATASLTAQPHAEKFNGIGRTRASFDQIGFVYAMNMGDFDGLKFVNIGVNYQKSRNFKNHINVQNFATGGMSQSWQMMDLAYSGGLLDLDNNEDRELTTPFTNLGYDTQLINPTVDSEGRVTGYSDADSYTYRRVQWGGAHELDFNIAANINDRLYVGVTAKCFFLNQKSYTDYSEMLINPDPANNSLHEYFYLNDERTEGEGYSGSLGVIFRPNEDNPFRVGLTIHMPTYYSIETSSDLYMETPYASGSQNYTGCGDRVFNQYEVSTPWRFNLSMGNTFGGRLALGAEYEFYDAGAMTVTYDEGFTKDYALKHEADRQMQFVHILRLGAEVILDYGLHMRFGYNYQSSPFKKSAYLNHFLDSSNYYYATNTDYVNLGELQRVTAGVGYRSGKWYADMAYQYQMQKADVYAFHVPEGSNKQPANVETFHVPEGSNNMTNRLQPAKVDLNRHNVQFTVGYKF